MRPLNRTFLLATTWLAGQLFGVHAVALNPVTWTIDETIDRSDSQRLWTSPTAIDLGLEDFSYAYELTRIDATVFGATINITGLVGDSFDLTGQGTAPLLPVLLLNDTLNDPSTGTMADVRIEVDTAGYGQAAFTNIVLGRASTPFGEADIERIRVQATVTLSGVVPTQPGDYNGDGAVDPSDYAAWSNAYGVLGPHSADGNRDRAVNAADYTVWRDRYESPLDAVATPEPAAATLALLTAGGLGLFRRRG